MGRRYLVTGGTGFLGSALVRRLVAGGHAVRVLDDDSRGNRGRLAGLEGRVECVRGDVRDAPTVADACRGVDVLCHLASVNGTEYFYSKPDVVLDVALKGMANVIDGALRHGVRELMVMSSSEVYQQPELVPTPETVPLSIPDCLNPRYSYAAGKILSEMLAINFGRRQFDRVTIVRPHNVYGPDMGREHVVPQFVARMQGLRDHPADPVPFPIQGTGEQTRAFVFVDDFIDGVMLVLEHGEHLGIYHVGTEEEVTIAELARRVAACYGRTIEVVAGPPAPGGTTRRCPDIGRMRRLGYEPRVALADALPRVVAWYDAQAKRAADGLRSAHE